MLTDHGWECGYVLFFNIASEKVKNGHLKTQADYSDLFCSVQLTVQRKKYY